MAKRYMILNNDGVKWIWDSQKKQMFREIDGLVEKADGNLHSLEKFDPFIFIEKQTNIRPLNISFNEKENRDRKLGII